MARAKIRFKIISKNIENESFKWEIEREEEYKKLEQAQEVLQELARNEAGNDITMFETHFINNFTKTITYIKKINLNENIL